MAKIVSDTPGNVLQALPSDFESMLAQFARDPRALAEKIADALPQDEMAREQTLDLLTQVLTRLTASQLEKVAGRFLTQMSKSNCSVASDLVFAVLGDLGPDTNHADALVNQLYEQNASRDCFSPQTKNKMLIITSTQSSLSVAPNHISNHKKPGKPVPLRLQALDAISNRGTKFVDVSTQNNVYAAVDLLHATLWRDLASQLAALNPKQKDTLSNHAAKSLHKLFPREQQNGNTLEALHFGVKEVLLRYTEEHGAEATANTDQGVQQQTMSPVAFEETEPDPQELSKLREENKATVEQYLSVLTDRPNVAVDRCLALLEKLTKQDNLIPPRWICTQELIKELVVTFDDALGSSGPLALHRSFLEGVKKLSPQGDVTLWAPVAGSNADKLWVDAGQHVKKADVQRSEEEKNGHLVYDSFAIPHKIGFAAYIDVGLAQLQWREQLDNQPFDLQKVRAHFTKLSNGGMSTEQLLKTWSDYLDAFFVHNQKDVLYNGYGATPWDRAEEIVSDALQDKSGRKRIDCEGYHHLTRFMFGQGALGDRFEMYSITSLNHIAVLLHDRTTQAALVISNSEPTFLFLTSGTSANPTQLGAPQIHEMTQALQLRAAGYLAISKKPLSRSIWDNNLDPNTLLFTSIYRTAHVQIGIEPVDRLAFIAFQGVNSELRPPEDVFADRWLQHRSSED